MYLFVAMGTTTIQSTPHGQEQSSGGRRAVNYVSHVTSPQSVHGELMSQSHHVISRRDESSHTSCTSSLALLDWAVVVVVVGWPRKTY